MDDILLWTQAAEAEAIAPAGLLDERRDAQGTEDAIARPPHIVCDGQHEAGGKLTEGCARAGEGGAVGEETQLCEQVVKGPGHPLHIVAMFLFHRRNVVGNAIKHAGRRLQQRPVDIPAQIAAFQHLQAVLAELDCAVIHIGRAGDSLSLALDDFEGREGLLCIGAIAGDSGLEGGHGDAP